MPSYILISDANAKCSIICEPLGTVYAAALRMLGCDMVH
jgi:hypothetical protein